MQSNIKTKQKGRIESSEKGFVLVVAVLGMALILAIGVLALTMSGQDIQISSRVVGEKKALTAAESGFHAMARTFNPDNLAGSAITNVQVDPTNDPATLYTIGTPVHPATGPGVIPLTGYSIGGGQTWGQTRYNVTVTGTNTSYNSEAKITVGVGYGPIESTTISR